MILELRKMEMEGRLIIRFVWIPGTRMIEQGSDALSRGDLSSGAMTGKKSFLETLPLNRTVWERQAHLKDEVRGWLPGDWKFVETVDWFHDVYKDPRGKYVWAPPRTGGCRPGVFVRSETHLPHD